MTAGDREDGGDEPTRALRSQLLDPPTLLRFVAFALIIVGFVGAVETGASPVGADSPFSLLFYAGVGCAVLSIYLGMYRQRPGAGSDGDERS